MRTSLVAALVLGLSHSALAQSISVDVNPFGGSITVNGPPVEVTTTSTRVEEYSGNGIHVRYVPTQDGSARLEIVEPTGAHVLASDGTWTLADDDIPTAFTAPEGKWIRIRLTLHDGAWVERKVQARAGLIGTVRIVGFDAPPPVVVVTPAPAPAPTRVTPSGHPDFARLRAAIEAESFSDQKLDVLRTAAASSGFTCDQVGELVDLFSFGDDKVEAVRIVRSQIVDPENAYTLYEHFTFSNDKERVKKLFAAN